MVSHLKKGKKYTVFHKEKTDSDFADDLAFLTNTLDRTSEGDIFNSSGNSLELNEHTSAAISHLLKVVSTYA